MLGRLGRGLTAAAHQASTSSGRGVTSLATRREDPNRCPPWPYRTKGYNHRDHFFTDHPQKRFDENSKFILVEGNVGSGKSTLAADLAKALGFYHIPEFRMDDILVTSFGVDKRDFYKYLPKSTAVPDMKMFYEDPYNPYNAQMQWHMGIGKFENHLNACAHIINTGQGVVMERSYHTDFAFVNACYEAGYYTYDFFRHYHTVRKYMLNRLHFWPHLVIYLDVPVEQCMQRIQARATPWEVSSNVLTPKYLDTIRNSYMDAMKDFKKHSRMLVYDWKTAADPDRVVEDVEAMDLDYYEWHDGEMCEEWSNIYDGWEWNGLRDKVTNKTPLIHDFYMIPSYEVDELHAHPEEKEQYIATMKHHVYGPHAVGYTTKHGDKAWDMAVKSTSQHPGAWYGFDWTEMGATKWYDHYYRDAWYNAEQSMFSFLDKDGKEGFNPYYNEHH